MTRSIRVIAVVVMLLLAVSACGTNDDSGGQAQGTSGSEAAGGGAVTGDLTIWPSPRGARGRCRRLPALHVDD